VHRPLDQQGEDGSADITAPSTVAAATATTAEAALAASPAVFESAREGPAPFAAPLGSPAMFCAFVHEFFSF
jgi:hypothetical protein